MQDPSSKKIRRIVGWVLLAAVAPAFGMILSLRQVFALAAEDAASAQSMPAYDVVLIKQNKSGSGGMSLGNDSNVFEAKNTPLRMIVANAYGEARPDAISGLPAWADSMRFDLTAKILNAGGTTIEKLTDEQRQAMLRAVLEERFGLKTHWETKDGPIYELIVAKGGAKLRDSSAGRGLADSMKAQGMGKGSLWIRNREMTAYGVTMDSLSKTLSRELRRNVVNKTDLTGEYDFTLKWAPLDPAASNPEEAPSITTAVQEQLGLKLQPARGPVETLVVDHAEMPTEN